ncbi:MAG TPA: amino acid adenylation domain-containing protein, partial [Thermoanaerobaculia bacterium]
RLVEELAPERSLARTPLFSVLFTLQHPQVARRELPGLVLEPFGLASPTAQFELAAVLTEEDGAVRGHLLYRAGLFDPATMARLAGHFANLVAAAGAAPGTPLAALPLLAAHELQQTLRECNDTAAELPRTASLDQLFERQVERTPAAVAACCGAAWMSYRELDRHADRLARRLAASGVGPEVPVGVCLERSLAALAAVLAVWKAGGIYVPLDPGYPGERLRTLVADSGCAVVVTSGELAGRLGGGAPTLLLEALDGPEAAALAGPAAARGEGGEGDEGEEAARLALRGRARRRAAVLGGEHGAYLLYTSGSTGRPKGVLVTHGALCHRLLWGQSVHPLAAGDRLLATASWSFDISLWELFAPLLAGACVVLPPAGAPLDLAGLARWIAAEGITVVHFVPSLLARFLAGCGLGDTRLRLVFCGGEALAGELRRRFAERVGAPLVHQYGPTEATITASVDAGDPGRPERVDLGRPIANHRLYLLDRDLRPVPLGAAGEVCIAGAGLARGYHGRPAATAERFLPDPWAEAPGERLYRTGDLGRRLSDGRLEFRGRADGQVKIHGIRIEPGEIEAALARHPGVAAAAVVARDEDAGERRLVAYLVPRREAGLDAAAAREFLAASLPRHLVPAAFVLLPALPLTPNGKLDRGALPAPERTRRGAQVAPRTPAEAALAAVWRAVLGLPAVGVEDNFFAAGGDSIRAIEVVAAARDAGLALTPRQL